MAKAKMLTPEEITIVMAHIERTSRYPERDRAMVLLSTRAGLRAAEIAALDWAHVLTADGTDVAEFIDLPRAVTKGQKRARVIPIHDELRAALEALRSAWSERVGSDRPDQASLAKDRTPRPPCRAGRPPSWRSAPSGSAGPARST